MAVISDTMKRRMRTYGRRALAVPGGRLRKRCFFMHIPKCGGSSIAEALYATVPIHKRVGVVDAPTTRRAAAIYYADRDETMLYHDDLETGPQVYALREQMLLAHMAWETELIHGHILFSEKAQRHFGDVYGHVTVLRDPIARMLSNFAHSAHDGFIPSDFDAYLDHYCARIHGLTTLRYLSGTHDIAPGEEAAALNRAKQTLASFDVVGFLDDLDGFCRSFADAFGRQPKIYRYNEARWPKTEPTAEQMSRLEAMMAPEIALWDYAQSLR